MRSLFKFPTPVAFYLAATLAVTPVYAVMAQTAPAAGANASQQAPQSPAGKFVQDLGNQAITAMANQSLTQDQRTQQYRTILQNSFDMETIAHFVLGRAWNSATPQQQEEFLKLFEQSVLKIYGDRLSFYSGEGFHITGERPESDSDATVSSEVTHKDSSAPTKVDWRISQKSGKPLVIDVVIEGVSQSITQRDEYAAILQRNNGNIDALINMMRQRAQSQGVSPAQ